MRPRLVPLLLALLLSCCGDEGGGPPVFLAAEPGSLLVGESVLATVRASEPFFENGVTVPTVSAGGLSLDSLVVQDDTTAIAELTSTAATAIGVHSFALAQGGVTARLDISVLNEPIGPGTVTAEGNIATAGATMATLTVHGDGTKFDTEVTAEVLGAEGFGIVDVAIQSETRLEIRYNISLEQAPVEATIVIHDGVLQYEVPFTILSPLALETTATAQALTKGRVGSVILSNPNAFMNASTEIVDAPVGVENGSVQVTSETEVTVPVRVPFDYAEDILSLTAYTYTEGGAYLEIITADVSLLEPAWLAATPSRLAAATGAQEIALTATGFDLSMIEGLTLEGDGISLASWSADSATEGTATLAVTSEATVEGYVLTADDSQRQIRGLVAYPGSGVGVFRSEESLAAGDHVHVAFVLMGGTLDSADTALASDGAFEVIGFTYIDSGCVIAEISSSPSTAAGLETLTLSSGGEEYEVHLAIAESGI